MKMLILVKIALSFYQDILFKKLTCLLWLAMAFEASAKAEMTLPKVTRLLLMCPPSFNLCPENSIKSN